MLLPQFPLDGFRDHLSDAPWEDSVNFVSGFRLEYIYIYIYIYIYPHR